MTLPECMIPVEYGPGDKDFKVIFTNEDTTATFILLLTLLGYEYVSVGRDGDGYFAAPWL